MSRKRTESYPSGVPVTPILEHCPGANGDNCAITRGEAAPIDKWRGTKVTVGMLGATLAAIILAWTTLATYGDRARTARERAISTHNVDEGAHQGLRREVGKLSDKVDKLSSDQRARHQELIRLLRARK
jgi:hypothetical protein